MNQSLFNYIYSFAGKNPLIDGMGIFLANYLTYFLVLGFLLLVLTEDGLRRKIYRLMEGILAVLLSRGIITEGIRFFYHHPRPFEFYGFAPLTPESGWSFPSGHMTFLFALVGVVWYIDRRWGIVYFLLSLVVGIARIYVGVHWPFDIIAGMAIGILSAIFIHTLLSRTRTELYTKRDADAS